MKSKTANFLLKICFKFTILYGMPYVLKIKSIQICYLLKNKILPLVQKRMKSKIAHLAVLSNLAWYVLKIKNIQFVT